MEREALIQRLIDAFEDAGLYDPDPGMVEAIYEDAVEPLRQQFLATREALGMTGLERARAVLALDRKAEE
jgi:hypothetical protein